MSDKTRNLAVKSCEIMQYFQYMDCNELAVIETRIKALTYLKSYSLILHDKDVLPSGKPKPPHFHAVLTFSNAKTIKAIADGIGVEMQYVEKIRTTTKSARLYHIHRNNPEKYQYSPKMFTQVLTMLHMLTIARKATKRVSPKELKAVKLKNTIFVNL